jgi:hypothetical protein
MSDSKSFMLKFFILPGMLLGLPLLGVLTAGYPVARYLEFPPRIRCVAHASFSWIAFALWLECAVIGAMLENLSKNSKSS